MTAFLTAERLAERWSIASATLSQWRWSGKGPRFLKIGGRVLYSIPDVEAFEAQKVRENTSQTSSPENAAGESNR